MGNWNIKRSRRDSNPRYLAVKRFSRPSSQNHKDIINKDLQYQQSIAYKPAYKENPKRDQNQVISIPDDFAEVVTIWQYFPEHTKAAIKPLIQ